jgi:DNA-binding transcriptional MocR family regulator
LRATRWGWKQKITSTEKLVLLELCDRINDKSKEDVCWPKQETIAERTGFTERTVNTALKELQARGLIKRQRRMIGGQRTSDMITVLIDGPQAVSSTAAPPSDSDPRPASPDVLLPEANSGGNPNDVPVPTGNTFSVIYKDKSTRLNQISPNFLYEFPEPGRPDLDALNYAARTIDEIAAELGTTIDWSAQGIQNLRPVVEWLAHLEEQKVIASLIEVTRRNRAGARAPIQSWAYFNAEMLKLTSGS